MRAGAAVSNNRWSGRPAAASAHPLPVAPELDARELRHRVRNLLSTVQAIAAISARSARGVDEFVRSLNERIVALGITQDALGHGGSSFDLRQMLRAQLQDGPINEAVRLDGQPVEVPAAIAIPLGMALHELKTNAVRFGSLSSPAGVLLVNWRVEHDGRNERIRINWYERGGPPAKASRRGFGTQLLDGLLGQRLRVERSFEPQGLSATIDITLSDA